MARGTSKTSFWQKALLVLASLLFSVLLLEGALHLLPVNELLFMQPVNDAQPMLRFAPDRTSRWSKFADFSMTNKVHANNYGFLNDQDYVTDAETPLIAVIGDSFIEAVMGPSGETMHGRMAAALERKARVYSFGVSGAPLSQYLAYADWAREEFHPDRMVFLVVGNDFDESLATYKQASGMHFFREKDGGFVLERQDYQPGWGVRLITGSKLLMYLFKNVEILHLFRTWTGAAPEQKYVGQTAAAAGEKRVNDSRRAVDEFFRRLPSAAGLRPDEITFVVDGMRPHLYSDEGLKAAEGSYYDLMRNYFMAEAEKRGYPVIDMQPLFVEDFAAHGKPFEYPRDGHWNGYAHGLAADALLHGGVAEGLAGGAQ